ncbi:MAG: glycosyltransferase family 4 protein [Cyclobacteriaceae bacterium]
MNILIFAQYFLPGFKAGGPIRSIHNLIQVTADQNKYSLITSDRDIKDPLPYKGVQMNRWVIKPNYKIYYFHRSVRSFIKVYFGIRHYDLIYLNSFFSPFFGILPCIAALGFQKKIIIAPRGEFSSGALAIKPQKKELYLKFFKTCNIQKQITWQATSPEEENNIKRIMGEEVRVSIAPNLSGQGIDHDEFNSIIKSKPPISKKLLLLFVGRVAEIKNLDFALSLLNKVTFPVDFSIFGPLEDQDYLQKCQNIINKLPSNVKVNFKGEVSHNQTQVLFQKHHFLFFPTKGENYSHVIAESLQNGCPVILSDQHPWKELEEQKAGWAIPLDSPERFLQVLNQFSRLRPHEYDELSANALLYWNKIYKRDLASSKTLYNKLFSENVKK